MDLVIYSRDVKFHFFQQEIVDKIQTEPLIPTIADLRKRKIVSFSCTILNLILTQFTMNQYNFDKLKNFPGSTALLVLLRKVFYRQRGTQTRGPLFHISLQQKYLRNHDRD